MNKNNEDLKFKKTLNEDAFMNEPIDYQKEKELLEARLMDEYKISLDDAEKLILNIGKKQQIKSKPIQGSKNEIKDALIENTVNSESLKEKNNANLFDSPYAVNVNKNKSDSLEKMEKDGPIPEIKNINQKSQQPIKDTKKQKIKKEVDIEQQDSSELKDVDDIIGEILPDYNQNISIEASHMDLTFEVSNEKIDTLKESFIRKIKRNKSKKLKIHAINDISFKIYKGEKVGIIGYNGAGKSTLLKAITGIYPLDKGFVKTYGNISPLLSLGSGFDHNFSGRKNIYLNGAVLGYDKSFLESKVDEIIEFSELGEFIDIPIKNYSSGMLAKLGFSIATIVNPDILIIDEILGVGDVTFNKKSRDKIRSLMDGGATVLLVSHSIPQIRELCDKAIWIDNGKLREIGEVNKVCDHYLKDAEKASNEQLANIQFR